MSEGGCFFVIVVVVANDEHFIEDQIYEYMIFSNVQYAILDKIPTGLLNLLYI